MTLFETKLHSGMAFPKIIYKSLNAFTTVMM